MFAFTKQVTSKNSAVEEKSVAEEAQYYKSINQTAFVLKESGIEAGLGSFNYGLTNDIMISTSTLTFFGSAATLSATKSVEIKEGIFIALKSGVNWLNPKISPFLNSFVSYRYKNYDFSAGLKINYEAEYILDSNFENNLSYKKKPSLVPQFSSNLDWHFRKDKFAYIGSKGKAFYIGSTVRVKSFFVGVISFGHKFPILVAPYFYFRF